MAEWTLDGFKKANPLDRYYLGKVVLTTFGERLSAADSTLWTKYLGISLSSLDDCKRVARTWPDPSEFEAIVHFLRTKDGPLEWSHFVAISKLDSSLHVKAFEGAVRESLTAKQISLLKPKPYREPGRRLAEEAKPKPAERIAKDLEIAQESVRKVILTANTEELSEKEQEAVQSQVQALAKMLKNLGDRL